FSRWLPMPLTLPPAQKAVPAPVISSAPTCGLSPQLLIMLRSAGVKSSESALRTSGRLSVITATRSRIAHSNSPVPVSTVISVVILDSPILFVRIIARSEATKQSIVGLAMPGYGLLPRFAPHNNDDHCNPSPFLKPLDPRPQLHFPGPGAARLLQHVPVAY